MSPNVELQYDRAPTALAYMLRGALPTTRRRDLAPPMAARWNGHRPDRRQLDAYLELTGLSPIGAATFGVYAQASPRPSIVGRWTSWKETSPWSSDISTT